MNSHIRKFFSAALFAFVTASTPALSQDTGWYGGLGIGQSTFVDSCTGVVGPGISCEEKDTAWKIFGGYQFNRNFAGEFGYADLGKTTVSLSGFGSASIGAQGFELTGVGSVPVNEQLSVYGRLGFFLWNVDLKAGVIGSASASGIGLTFGFGASFNVATNAALRLEWQRYKDVGDANTTSKGDIDLIGAGLVVKF
jgi:OOP family OmpA-OmpF porin